MNNNLLTCENFTLNEEGDEYTDDPDDPGGATKEGITLITLSLWRGSPCTKEDVKGLTRNAVLPIYRALYWNTICADALYSGMDLMVYDFGVNASTHRSGLEIQQLLGFTDKDLDGYVGPRTIARLRSVNDQKGLIQKLSSAQTQFYKSLNKPKFEKGWLSRTTRRTQLALQLLSTSTKSTPIPVSIIGEPMS